MSPLHEALGDYLAMRRVLGYKLQREGQLLPQFLDFVLERGEQYVSTESALAWATLPAASGARSSARLRFVRGFATYLHAIDPAHEVPAPDLLPSTPRRPTPYLYDPAQITTPASSKRGASACAETRSRTMAHNAQARLYERMFAPHKHSMLACDLRSGIRTQLARADRHGDERLLTGALALRGRLVSYACDCAQAATVTSPPCPR